jgi:hypothetical protein
VAQGAVETVLRSAKSGDLRHTYVAGLVSLKMSVQRRKFSSSHVGGMTNLSLQILAGLSGRPVVGVDLPKGRSISDYSAAAGVPAPSSGRHDLREQGRKEWPRGACPPRKGGWSEAETEGGLPAAVGNRSGAHAPSCSIALAAFLLKRGSI